MAATRDVDRLFGNQEIRHASQIVRDGPHQFVSSLEVARDEDRSRLPHTPATDGRMNMKSNIAMKYDQESEFTLLSTCSNVPPTARQ